MNTDWKKVDLDAICTVQSGGTPSRKETMYFDGKIPWAKIDDLNTDRGIVFSTEEQITDAGLKNIRNRIFPKGTLFLAMYGSVGKTAFAGVEMSCNQAILGINPKRNNIDMRYINYWFKQENPKLLNRAVGVTQKNLSTTIVKNLQIPLPPLPIQQKIADILDQAEELRRKREESIRKLEELEKAIIEKSFNKFDEHNLVKKRSLEEVSIKITDGTHQSPNFRNAGIPFIFVSNIINNTISLKTEKYISDDEYRTLTKNTPIEKGDILFTTVGSYGNPAIIDFDDKFCFQRHIAQIKPKKEVIDPYYLYLGLMSRDVKRQVEKMVKGVAQKTLNLKDLKKIEITLLNEKEQNIIVTKCKEIEELKIIYSNSCLYYKKLFNSLLQKAFQGELIN